MSYRHIDEMERERIAAMVHRGAGVAAIARALGRGCSSITRELARNRSCDGSGQWGYFVCQAQRQASRRAQVARRPRVLIPGSRLWQPVMSKLRRGWSPEQIAHRLRMQYPDEPERWVSHQTIYHALEVLPRGELKAELKRHLRRQGKPAKGVPSSLLGAASTSGRPRRRTTGAGHWEGDLIVGQGNRSAVGVMVERTPVTSCWYNWTAKTLQRLSRVCRKLKPSGDLPSNPDLRPRREMANRAFDQRWGLKFTSAIRTVVAAGQL